jgi:hypothetical protein
MGPTFRQRRSLVMKLEAVFVPKHWKVSSEPHAVTSLPSEAAMTINGLLLQLRILYVTKINDEIEYQCHKHAFGKWNHAFLPETTECIT